MIFDWFWFPVLIYVAGFVLTYIVNINIGPVTPGLSLLRAFVWPLWWLTGKPEGERMRMD